MLYDVSHTYLTYSNFVVNLMGLFWDTFLELLHYLDSFDSKTFKVTLILHWNDVN